METTTVNQTSAANFTSQKETSNPATSTEPTAESNPQTAHINEDTEMFFVEVANDPDAAQSLANIIQAAEHFFEHNEPVAALVEMTKDYIRHHGNSFRLPQQLVVDQVLDTVLFFTHIQTNYLVFSQWRATCDRDLIQ